MTEKEVKQITDAMTKVFFKWLESPEFDAKVESIIHRVLGEYTSEVVESSYTILYEKIDKVDERLQRVEKDVATLKTDVATLKEDVADLKQDMRLVKRALSSQTS